MVSKGNHPQMALIQVSEILQFTQINSMVILTTGFFGQRWPAAGSPDFLSAHPMLGWCEKDRTMGLAMFRWENILNQNQSPIKTY